MSDAVPQLVPAAIPLDVVGRRTEFERIMARLDAAEPALVTLAGEDGMGKTTMLEALEDEALARGWSSARCRDERVVRIQPHSTSADFWHDVERSLRSHVERRGRESLDEVMSTTATGADPYAARLAHSAPVVVLVDGYRPSALFHEWFTARYVEEIRRSQAAVVLVVADRPPLLETLVQHADEVVELGALDAAELDAWLDGLGRQLAPPMTPAERRRYVDAIVDRPECKRPLLRVLELTHAAAPAEAAR